MVSTSQLSTLVRLLADRVTALEAGESHVDGASARLERDEHSDERNRRYE